MSIAFIALGSNLGDRESYLDTAIERLRAEPGCRVLAVSPYFETAPVGGPSGQGAYLNATAKLETDRAPQSLLALLLAIEKSLGRVRGESNAPRTLDLDLLLHGDTVRTNSDPLLPHPRMHERRFVLAPLAEIAAEWVHPVLHKSIAQLLAELPQDSDPPRVFERSSRAACRELLGKKVVVTGSSSGIGRAMALELARAGADLVLHGRERSRESLRRLANEVRELGRHAEVACADFANAAERDAFAEQAWRLLGGVDIWIHNAGADTLTGEAANWSFERKLRELLAVDLEAAMVLCRAAGERMKAGAGGAIVTIGWDQAETGMEGDSGQLFAAVKGAVICFTRSLAKTLAPQVRVNCIAPGWIRTAWGETASATWQERVRSETPLQRWGLPEEVARVARWLVGPGAGFQTGQVIRVNGGVV